MANPSPVPDVVTMAGPCNVSPQLISRSAHWDHGVEVALKRFIDIVVSSVAIILGSPLYLLIAIAIKADSPGPVLYTWNVVGEGGQPLVSWKFRSMFVDADARKKDLLSQNEMTGPVFKLEADPRITRVGKWLRRFSLDELPQVISVLTGDLSLVGPRPPLQSEYKEFSSYQKLKLSVKPGLTCLWQVSGRNEIRNFDDWVALDLAYIANWSLMLDFKILGKTALAMVRGTGR
jgi:lipopolysaccharide/colanic/teichoic acid biosynthesis glycosyltransferase